MPGGAIDGIHAPEGFEVEFVAASGHTQALVTLGIRDAIKGAIKGAAFDLNSPSQRRRPKSEIGID